MRGTSGSRLAGGDRVAAAALNRVSQTSPEQGRAHVVDAALLSKTEPGRVGVPDVGLVEVREVPTHLLQNPPSILYSRSQGWV